MEAVQTDGTMSEAAGQTAVDPNNGATNAAPAVEPGQPQESEPESFYNDMDAIKANPALMSAYKNMQAAFTKKMQGISSEAAKIKEYNAFMANPVDGLKRLASQFGLTVAEARAAVAEAKAEQGSTAWQPSTWDEVLERAEKRAEEKIFSKLSPLIDKSRQDEQRRLESALDELDPVWRQYEDRVAESLQQVPQLLNDPERLLRFALPPEIQEARIMAKTQKRLESKRAAAQIGGVSTTSQMAKTGLESFKPKNIQEAAEYAKRMLREQGHSF